MPLQKKSYKKSTTKPKVVAVLGQSGAGKSALALKLARRFGGVIIAADAHTIYRGFDIGTAKPTRAEQRMVPHFMLNVVSAKERYSAADFQKKVNKLVYKLNRTHPNRPIFLVGGTLLYVDAVLKGLDFSAAPPDLQLRVKLNKLARTALLTRLCRVDPITARKIDRHNHRRLVRALEVALTTGHSFYKTRQSHPPDWDVLKLGVILPQSHLDRRNLKRIDRMFRAGWTAEVRQLAKKYPRSAPGFLAHGYREVQNFIAGQSTLAETKKIIANKTRQNTRRQLRWLKKDPEIIWLGPNQTSHAPRLVKAFLKKEGDQIRVGES